MKKFTYDVIKQPNLSNRLELKTHVLVENHIDEITFAAWGDDGAETSLFAILPALFVNANEIYGNLWIMFVFR